MLDKPGTSSALAAAAAGSLPYQSGFLGTTYRWSDVLVTALTLGLVSPRSVTYEGVVIGRAAAGQTGQ